MLKTSKELLEYIIHATHKREDMKGPKLYISAILAGMAIAFGAVGNILVSADLIETNVGVAKFIGASVFPVGLILIVLLGFELFTSNCLMVASVFDRKISWKKMFEILALVWIFNLIGSVIIAYISYETGTLSEAGVKLLSHMAEHKVNTGAYDLILKGILCNVLVSSACLGGYMSKDGVSKAFTVWFPIMLFIVLGYDHVVANMLYLPLALMHGAEGVTLLGVLYNFFFVTIGNFLGGGFVVGLSYWFLNKDVK